MSDKFILEGRKVKAASFTEWAEWFENFDNRNVAKTELDNGVLVSTVFLGTDHGFGVRRQLFETMVFGGSLDQEQVRYETYDEAEAGHKEMVERAKK